MLVRESQEIDAAPAAVSAADGRRPLRMRRLMLLRHARAERSRPGERDRDRHLDDGGRAEVRPVGAYLARHDLLPDAVLVSPATRARETWDLIAEALGRAVTPTQDERLYAGGADAILEAVRETAPHVAVLLVVGHNPALHQLAMLLVASGDLDLRQRLNEGLPTAGLTVIDFALDSWARLHPHGGRLERFVTPQSLAAATD